MPREILLVVCLDKGDKSTSEYDWLIEAIQNGIAYYGNTVEVLRPRPRMTSTALDSGYNEAINQLRGGRFDEIWFIGKHLPHSGCVKLLIAAADISVPKRVLVNYSERKQPLDGFLRIHPQVKNRNGRELAVIKKLGRLLKP